MFSVVLLLNVLYFRCGCVVRPSELVHVIMIIHLESVCSAEHLIHRISEFTWKLRISEAHICMLKGCVSGATLARGSGFVILDVVSFANTSLERSQEGSRETVNREATVR